MIKDPRSHYSLYIRQFSIYKDQAEKRKIDGYDINAADSHEVDVKDSLAKVKKDTGNKKNDKRNKKHADVLFL